MNKILLLLALGGVPKNDLIHDQVDVLHRSQVFDGATGEERVDQIGGLRWDPNDGCYHWHWWRLTGKAAVPRRDYRRGGWVMTWYDAKTHSFRQVRATSYNRSITAYDPETEDRTRFPREHRWELTVRPIAPPILTAGASQIAVRD